jgi:hypothetical protein
MIRAIAITACALTLAVGTAAWAERVSGQVQRIDAASGIVHFTDGRIVHLEPNAVITVDGRTVAFDQLRPGMNVVLGERPGVVTALPPQAWAGHPPIDATGRVARVDQQTGTVTFDDGRSVRVGPDRYVWEPRRLQAVRPGDQIFVSNAQPVGYQAAGVVTSPSHRSYLGTVASVDQSKAHVVLRDGRVVRVTPQTRMSMGDRAMLITDLRPGDELVVTVLEPQPVVGIPATQPGAVVVDRERDGASALPRGVFGGAAFIDASDVKIIRRPEAP